MPEPDSVTKKKVASLKVKRIWLRPTGGGFGKTELSECVKHFYIPMVQPGLTLISILIASISGSGNVLKVQQLLHICSEHYEAKEKEKEDDKEKKDKKDKKESDMGSHQVKIFSHQLFASVSSPEEFWLGLSYL